MTAYVNPDICIGCTLCVQTCPDVFRMEDDKAVAFKNPVPEALKQACKEAAEQCPVDAITVKE